MSTELFLTLWAIGFVLAMLCFIFFWGFENNEGRTEVTGTRVLCYVLMSLIGNWAFVVFYLIVGGIHVVVWIGEKLEKVFDHIIYKSHAPKKQSKKINTNK